MHKVNLYQQNNSVQVRDALLFLNENNHRFRWKKENRVLDIGSGDGYVTNILKDFILCNFILLGSDLNENMVKYANEHHRDEQTSFTVLDIASELPEEMKGNFDHIFSFYTLHWVKDQKLAFTNIFELLEPNGECFMIYLAWNPIYEVFRIQARNKKWQYLLRDVEKYISPHYDSQDPAKEVSDIMENIGFINIDVECKEMFFVYENMEKNRESVSAIIPFNIPKEKYKEFMDEFMEELRKINTAKETQINYKLLIVYGRKPEGPLKQDV